MLTLIDTVIGFTVIMLLLSFLIKSLTSVVKNHVQYYRQNLVSELDRLLKPYLAEGLRTLQEQLPNIDWRNIGEELFDEENLRPILEKFDSSLQGKLTDLKARLTVHKAALEFGFDRRMKNLSLACGTALCLILNINALSIWTHLYNDGEVRAKFASEKYVNQVLEQAGQEVDETLPEDEKAALEQQRQEWEEELRSFRQEVDFGVGAVWTKRDPSLAFVLYQLVGSLLTGFLASVGAPYLHDFLRAVASFRRP